LTCGASRYEATELVLRRGSRQPKQPLGRLPSRDREVLPLIPLFPHYSLAQGVLVDRLPDYRGLRGSRLFWVPGARFWSGGGQITHLLLGLVKTSGLFAPGAETRANKLLAFDAFGRRLESVPPEPERLGLQNCLQFWEPGLAGDPFTGKTRRRGCKGGAPAAKFNFSLGSEKPKGAARDQLGGKAQV